MTNTEQTPVHKILRRENQNIVLWKHYQFTEEGSREEEKKKRSMKQPESI